MLDLHSLAIIVHAVSATGAFLIGIVFLFQRKTIRQRQLGAAFVVLLILMEVFLIIAILSHVTNLPVVTQIIFAGLAFTLTTDYATVPEEATRL